MMRGEQWTKPVATHVARLKHNVQCARINIGFIRLRRFFVHVDLRFKYDDGSAVEIFKKNELTNQCVIITKSNGPIPNVSPNS